MKRASISLDEHAFCYYNTAVNRWVEEPGEYELRVGASSRDIRLRLRVERQGEPAAAPYDPAELPHYFKADVADVPDAEFSALLGRALPQSHLEKSNPLNQLDTVGQGWYKKGFARLLYNLVRLVRRVCFLLGKPIAGNNVMFAMHLPYRALARMSGGMIDKSMLEGILVMVNGQFWKGLRQTLRAHREKRTKRK